MALKTYTIQPTNKYDRPPPPSRIRLHGLDLLNPPIQIHNHRFFRPMSSPISEVIDNLKSSLAEALELYPPVAGTVIAEGNGEVYIAMNTEHNVGTPFVVDMKDTPYAGDTEDLSPRTDMLLPPSSSTLAVKVTQFSCGTIAVASSIHHQVADLRGFLDFLELWARLARRETVDFAKVPDDWSHCPGRFFSGLIEKSTIATTIAPAPFEVLPTPASGPPPFLLVPSDITRWVFTKSSMERLKTEFSPSASPEEDKSGRWISSGDALAALLSGAIARARENGHVPRLEGRSSLASETETIAMAADGRERAPEGNMTHGRYFGNFNPLCSSTVSRSDLLSLHCDAASRVALAIRNALNLQLSPKALAHKISFFEDPRNTQPSGRITWSADIILTNWCRFDLQGPAYAIENVTRLSLSNLIQLDFGWGKPFCTTSGAGSIFPPGYCLMTQNKDSGHIFVMMTVEKEGADALRTDPLLNKYAARVPVHPNC